MKIESTNTILEVKTAFSDRFPGLKIEFYKYGHDINELSRKEDMLEDDIQLLTLSEDFQDGELTLDERKTAIEIEAEMKEKFDLHIQVFRKSNNIWLQTSKTDHWTLYEQNRKGLNSVQ